MRKQLTGEPVAGELHTGFGGRGRRQPFPTPIRRRKPAIGQDEIIALERRFTTCGRLREMKMEPSRIARSAKCHQTNLSHLNDVFIG